MSIADDLLPSSQVPWQTCSVKWVLENAGTDYEVVDEAIKNNLVAASKISIAIKKNLKMEISADAIRRHRRGDCRCAQWH